MVLTPVDVPPPVVLAALLGMTACTLDPAALLTSANLLLHVEAIDAAAVSLDVAVTDRVGDAFLRAPPVDGARVDVYVGGLAAGQASVVLQSRAGSGALLQCRRQTVRVNETRTEVRIVFGSADTPPCAAASDGGPTPGGDAGAPGDGCTATVATELSEQCSNSIDDDCDGLTDCDDPDCAGAQRDCATATSCAGMQVCAAERWGKCTAAAPIPESNPSLCGDGLDNDCDGSIDCDDSACQTCMTCGC